jgi:hypothetical protein
MSTKDQLLYSAVHGIAMRYAAERSNLAESIAELREIADDRDHVLVEAAGITVGSWYAWPSTHVGYELVAAGMLIMASGHDGKPLDSAELERWTRTGFERGMRFVRARGSHICGKTPARSGMDSAPRSSLTEGLYRCVEVILSPTRSGRA